MLYSDLALVTAALGLCVAAGCGGPKAPPRYDLSGTVTCDGKPVPTGYLIFTPDTTKGNSGPGSQADISNGRYQTAPGQGTVGGPHVVAICGFDGKPIDLGEGRTNPQGTPLFLTYRVDIDFPKRAAVQDFAISAEGKRPGL